MAFAAGPAAAQPSEHPFEIVPGSFHFTPSTTQAAAHSDWVTSFDFAHTLGKTNNDVRTTVHNLPVGFTGNITAVPTCTQAQLLLQWPKDLAKGENISATLSACPPASQIGTITFDVNGSTTQPAPNEVTVPIYNMEVTSFGIAAEIGFKSTILTQVLQIGLRPDDSGITVTTPNIPKLGEPRNVTVTIWGLPASHEHDAERGQICGVDGEHPPVCHEEYGGPKAAGIAVKPFLSNPTSCGAFTATMEAYSWEEPENVSKASSETGPIGECDRVPFEPSIEVQPTTNAAESPSGLNVSLVVPQSWDNPFSISTANLKDTKVTLPEGITVNPSAGSGLGACTPGQYEAETSASLPGEGCPAESKIGAIEIETPLLAEKILGAVYVAKPFDNPFNSLLALYIVAKAPDRGIIIKVAGKVELNPVTGQLSTTFDNTPQQPFSRFTLKFRPGATAPLVSPPACGSYAAQAALTPWSAPTEPRLVSSTPFEVTQGVHEGPCPAGGVPLFHPQAIAGTLNNASGSYSPLYIRISRNDGEQEITGFASQLPPGLTGNLNGIPFCGEAEIAAAHGQTGQQAEEHPACPAASQIGHTIAEAGVGTVLAQTPGELYLGGPYQGAPFSVVSVTSAKVGPFDLGTVVVHLPLQINPETAAVTIPSGAANQIPHIIKGIVIHLRAIRVYIDREHFMLNPTSCDRMSLSATVIGGGADPTNPADNTPVTVNDPFQAADCANLQFKPLFQVSTAGHASKADGASLTVKLTYPVAPQGTQSNIRYVKVELPRQLPSELKTLQKACLAAVFDENPEHCPEHSIVGHATAVTPILPVPISGNAYFVSYGGAQFPELIVVLKGDGVTIDLHGETFISKAGITSSTFKAVPDQPVTSFELTLPAQPYSALAPNLPNSANYSFCGQKMTMPTHMIAQNGMEIKQETPITVTGCPAAITVVSHGVKGRTATIQVRVPGAGRLVATAKGLSKASKTAKAATTLTLKLTLTNAEAAFLGKHKGRKLKATVNLQFTPKKGGKLKTSTTVIVG
jgi:hypothetical protein